MSVFFFFTWFSLYAAKDIENEKTASNMNKFFDL